MNRFRRYFWIWLAVLIGFFIAANLAGAVRPMGLKPIRFIGFPYTFAAWGLGIKSFFDAQLLAANTLIGIVASVVLAAICSWARSRADHQATSKSDA
jgi:hypothetical protein